jgi:5'-3' exonuclease
MGKKDKKDKQKEEQPPVEQIEEEKKSSEQIENEQNLIQQISNLSITDKKLMEIESYLPNVKFTSEDREALRAILEGEDESPER